MNLVIFWSNIQLDEVLYPLELIKKIINLRQRVMVLNNDLVEDLVIYA
jgi:hypothetical protein